MKTEPHTQLTRGFGLLDVLAMFGLLGVAAAFALRAPLLPMMPDVGRSHA